jgi:hypothetical protein
MKKMTIHTIKGLLRELKEEALRAGRYNTSFYTKDYDNRDKSKAFRCMAYNSTVRRINALEEVIVEIS